MSWDSVKKRVTHLSNADVCQRMLVHKYRSLIQVTRGTSAYDVIRLREKVKRLEERNAQLISLLNQVRDELHAETKDQTISASSSCSSGN
jgi:hypothetical protein